MWHVSSRSSVATLRTAIHLLLTYFYIVHVVCNCYLIMSCRSKLQSGSAILVPPCSGCPEKGGRMALHWSAPHTTQMSFGWNLRAPRTIGLHCARGWPVRDAALSQINVLKKLQCIHRWRIKNRKKIIRKVTLLTITSPECQRDAEWPY